MLSPRIRRLKLDYDQMTQKFAGWPLIEITGTAGMPPEVYRFKYNIKGLFVSPTGDIQERDIHFLEVNLSLGYPRRAPQCARRLCAAGGAGHGTVGLSSDP